MLPLCNDLPMRRPFLTPLGSMPMLTCNSWPLPVITSIYLVVATLWNLHFIDSTGTIMYNFCNFFLFPFLYYSLILSPYSLLWSLEFFSLSWYMDGSPADILIMTKMIAVQVKFGLPIISNWLLDSPWRGVNVNILHQCLCDIYLH